MIRIECSSVFVRSYHCLAVRQCIGFSGLTISKCHIYSAWRFWLLWLSFSWRRYLCIYLNRLVLKHFLLAFLYFEIMWLLVILSWCGRSCVLFETYFLVHYFWSNVLGFIFIALNELLKANVAISNSNNKFIIIVKF